MSPNNRVPDIFLVCISQFAVSNNILQLYMQSTLFLALLVHIRSYYRNEDKNFPELQLGDRCNFSATTTVQCRIPTLYVLDGQICEINNYA